MHIGDLLGSFDSGRFLYAHCDLVDHSGKLESSLHAVNDVVGYVVGCGVNCYVLLVGCWWQPSELRLECWQLHCVYLMSLLR